MSPQTEIQRSSTGRDVVVIGASAGGVGALCSLIRTLPADFPAALFVALHLPPHSKSALPAILSRHGNLPAVHPVVSDARGPTRRRHAIRRRVPSRAARDHAHATCKGAAARQRAPGDQTYSLILA